MVKLENLIRTAYASMRQYNDALRKAEEYESEGKHGLANASYKEALLKKEKASFSLKKAYEANIHFIKEVTFLYGDKKYIYNAVDMEYTEIVFFLKMVMQGITKEELELEILEIKENRNLVQEIPTI